MNTPQLNRAQIAMGTATATSGMKRLGLGVHNRPVFGGDRWPELWPCKRDHPPHRIKRRPNGRLTCLECQLEKAHERRGVLI